MTKIVKTSRTEEDTYTAFAYDIINEDGTEVGYMNVSVSDSGTYCESIVVYERFRNNGYGTAALRALSDEYNGVTVAPDNEDARRLYERIGSESRCEDADYIDQGFGVYDI